MIWKNVCSGFGLKKKEKMPGGLLLKARVGMVVLDANHGRGAAFQETELT